MVPPEDAWLRRTNNEAVVGCYTSRQTWHLRCVDNVWTGVIGNCTREMEMAEPDGINPPEVSPIKDQVLITVAVATFGVIICIVIIICGAVCVRRYNMIVSKSNYTHQQDKASVKYWQASPNCQQAPLNGTGLDGQA